MCYDDGCHLKKYASNDKRAEQTPTAQKLATMHIVIDKMHFRGHTDAWCQEHCNPYKYDDLDNVSFMSFKSFTVNINLYKRWTPRFTSRPSLGCPDMPE